jgi:hypothetical protein
MAKNPTPQWQPISMLPVIAVHIDGMLETAEEQYSNLQEARPKPHVLDDYTVGRVIEVFTTQQNDLWLFDELLSRWKAGKLTTAQQQDVARLVAQMKRLREVVTAILALADELKERTIEKVMAKSEAELGLEALFNALKNESWPG